MKNDARNIRIVSDCGHYEIIARLLALQDCYSLDNWTGVKSYSGSAWSCTMRKDGKRIDYITSEDGVAYVHFGRYGTGLCPHGMALNKNTILYGAFLTGRFTKELDGIDFKKVQKRWMREYVKARIDEEMEKGC